MTMFETISDLSTITGGQAAPLPAPTDDFGRPRSPFDLGGTVGSGPVSGNPLRPTRDPYPPIYQQPTLGGGSNWVR
jgi:hypothetical protein